MKKSHIAASAIRPQVFKCVKGQQHSSDARPKRSGLGVCDYHNMWYHDFADYCLKSITINRLIGDLDNSAANKTILLLQVLKVMLMPSADYQFNSSLQCASKIVSASDLRGCGP